MQSASIVKLMRCGTFAKANILNFIAKRDALVNGFSVIRPVHYQINGMSGFIKSRTIFDNATSMASQQGLRMLFSTEPPKPVVENEVRATPTSPPTPTPVANKKSEEDFDSASTVAEDEETDAEDTDAEDSDAEMSADLMSEDNASFTEEEEVKGTAAKPATTDPVAQPAV